MDAIRQIQEIKTYVKDLFLHDTTGHDVEHMQRVAQLAVYIAEKEGADSYLCEVAAWLHDVGDHKLFDQPDVVKEELQQFLRTLSFTSIEINTILSIIDSVSFTKGKRIPDTLEGKIVQDADRLDAIGAIGIARTFAYGGAKGQRLYDSNETNNSSLRHFSDKLLKLRDVMHTRSARGIAEQRHAFMENYLKQFLSEWNFSE